jgi:thymidylate kinase
VVTAGLEKFVPSWIAEKITDGRMRLSDGGLVVALVGGDGAGKSTCARELNAWLAPFRTMRAHLGNPPRSWLTLAVGGALKLELAFDRLLKRPARTGTTIQLLRHLCTARDRYSLYVKIRRFAVSGGVGICERYPITENRLLVGPVIPQDLPPQAGGLARLLCALEARYYDRILRPDLVVVLRLDPELAVIRKPEEPADYVRARGRVIWNTDWSASGAQVVDASQPLDEVMRRLKTIIWSHL